MRQRKWSFIVSWLCGLTLTLQAQTSRQVNIFAAASLTDAFEQIAQVFMEQHPEIEVLLQFGSSSTLATQLLEGAPADVFASANETQMDKVREAGLIDEAAIVPFVSNRLTLIIPVDNPAQITSAEDLTRTGILLTLAAPEVPIRKYTDEALLNLETLYGVGYRERVLANLVSEEDNVRQVVARIALGEADVGIVYHSDVTPDMAEKVLAIALPAGMSPIALYPIAPLLTSAHPEDAQAFIDFVLSEQGQAILADWGFCPPLLTEDNADRAESTPEATLPTTSEEICG